MLVLFSSRLSYRETLLIRSPQSSVDSNRSCSTMNFFAVLQNETTNWHLHLRTSNGAHGQRCCSVSLCSSIVCEGRREQCLAINVHRMRSSIPRLFYIRRSVVRCHSASRLCRTDAAATSLRISLPFFLPFPFVQLGTTRTIPTHPIPIPSHPTSRLGVHYT